MVNMGFSIFGGIGMDLFLGLGFNTMGCFGISLVFLGAFASLLLGFHRPVCGDLTATW